MDVINITYIPEASVTLFETRLSESEVVVFSDCINYMLKHCTDEQINLETECSNKEELSFFLHDLLGLMRKMDHRKYLPERYKKL